MVEMASNIVRHRGRNQAVELNVVLRADAFQLQAPVRRTTGWPHIHLDNVSSPNQHADSGGGLLLDSAPEETANMR